MKHDIDAPKNRGRQGAGLAAKLLVALSLTSAIILLTGAACWWTLRTARHEIGTAQLTAGADAAAMADGLLTRIDETGLALVAGVILVVVLMGCLYLYLVRSVIQPLRINARLMSRLAKGDGSENVPAGQLERNDEIGDLARAIRDVAIHQREEVGIANDMSAGDFTRAVAVRDPDDALRLAIRRMAGVTIETLKSVNTLAGQLMAGCEAIASANGELSTNSAGIAAAVTEISTGIVRVKTHADDNAGMAEQAGRLADTGSQSVERGYKDIGEMGVVMLNMQACGDKIVRIAKSIGDIAFQTNLLALNASVEAARAGRHGKGFTIVAEEVRNLASRTSQAAKETSSLMKDTVEQVELAAAIAGRINATFSEMQTNLHETDALLEKIAAASREQSGGMEQISATLRQVDRSAGRNREYVVGVSEKTDYLLRQTHRLHRMMGHFRLDFRRSPEPEAFAGSDVPSMEVRIPRAITRARPES